VQDSEVSSNQATYQT